jgi:hypothetical protein
MELCRRNNTLQVFVIIKDDMIGTYLGFDIIAVETQCTGNASLINEMSGNSTSVIDFTHCINKAILHYGNNVDSIGE